MKLIIYPHEADKRFWQGRKCHWGCNWANGFKDDAVMQRFSYRILWGVTALRYIR